jgi:hypothetical protein
MMLKFVKEEETLFITLPEGKTQEELIQLTNSELEQLISADLYGRNLKINGRLTTGMALFLGHKLAHICKSVSVFDPKENSYVMCIKH